MLDDTTKVAISKTDITDKQKKRGAKRTVFEAEGKKGKAGFPQKNPGGI